MTNSTGRSTRPRIWFDPRLAIGLVLVVASVVGVAVVVATADRTSEVYVARSALFVGDHVGADNLSVARVRLGDVSGRYVSPGELPSAGLLITRTVQAGELIPAGAVGTLAGASVTSIVVTVRPALAASIVPGSVVDLWAATKLGPSSYSSPAVLAPAATVVRIIAPSGFMSTSDGQSVEILVPKSAVGSVLQSIANGDVISIVAVDSPLEGDAAAGGAPTPEDASSGAPSPDTSGGE